MTGKVTEMSPLQDLGPEGVWDKQTVTGTVRRNGKISVGVSYLFLDGPPSCFYNADRRDNGVRQFRVLSLRELLGQGVSVAAFGSWTIGDGELMKNRAQQAC